MLSEAEIASLQSEKKYFIENIPSASYFQVLNSKGTNFNCYLEYLNSLNEEQKIDNVIEKVRVIAYALHKPFQFLFFYWTILIIVLYKFNFKKPVMKIILGYFTLSIIGNIIEKFGDLLSFYYSNSPEIDEKGNTIYKCVYKASSPEMHPLKWVLTRQICSIFWYTGEIIADWYPMIRIKEVEKDRQVIKYIYISFGIYNATKILLIFYYFFLSPRDLYDANGVYNAEKVNQFYFPYWSIQLFMIFTAVIYNYTIYFVLKKNFSKENQSSNIGFIKKFKNFSEYRLMFSSIVNVILLPLVSISIIFKFYYYYKYNYSHIDFSFDEIKQNIINLSYNMIFIDQIFPLISRKDSDLTSTSNLSKSNQNVLKIQTNNNNNNYNNEGI
ncbi:hypothetical protein BCR32DRAFT_268282 [Anaeromyces robustus]|uniref:Uncharacterized protein n=1 Tax=Anaeromyces robustus TaxID=1754192 RepID=A0A1Y1X6I3_9FUNG|nr:hypothetical protein BCR32DRAFT_268282 [Anaeromyces robustus]|eukprot:ORX81427.1 hypothetical protein BCR32DRAFT_268282 [Anaeromyces robustus]